MNMSTPNTLRLYRSHVYIVHMFISIRSCRTNQWHKPPFDTLKHIRSCRTNQWHTHKYRCLYHLIIADVIRHVWHVDMVFLSYFVLFTAEVYKPLHCRNIVFDYIIFNLDVYLKKTCFHRVKYKKKFPFFSCGSCARSARS